MPCSKLSSENLHLALHFKPRYTVHTDIYVYLSHVQTLGRLQTSVHWFEPSFVPIAVVSGKKETQTLLNINLYQKQTGRFRFSPDFSNTRFASVIAPNDLQGL